ncbi:hypothetical protein DMUE_3653 [Dictyocoela muelleri]|nr:hypothetical protein DMUE_3653 [Dictyocoela muelleri]
MIFLFFSTLNSSKIIKAIRISPITDINLEISKSTLKLVPKESRVINYFEKEDGDNPTGSYLKADGSILWKEGNNLQMTNDECKDCFWSFNPMNDEQFIIARDNICWKRDGENVVLDDCPTNGAHKSAKGENDKSNGGKNANEKGAKEKETSEKGTKEKSTNEKDSKEKGNNDKATGDNTNSNKKSELSAKNGFKSEIKSSKIKTDDNTPISDNSTPNSASDVPTQSKSGSSTSENTNLEDKNFIWKIKIEDLPSKVMVNSLLKKELDRNIKAKNENPKNYCGIELSAQDTSQSGNKKSGNSEKGKNDHKNIESKNNLNDRKIENAVAEEVIKNDEKQNVLKNELNSSTPKIENKNNEKDDQKKSLENGDPKISPESSTPVHKSSITNNPSTETPKENNQNNIASDNKAGIPSDISPDIPSPKDLSSINPATKQLSEGIDSVKKGKLPPVDVEKLKGFKKDMEEIEKNVKSLVEYFESLDNKK